MKRLLLLLVVLSVVAISCGGSDEVDSAEGGSAEVDIAEVTERVQPAPAASAEPEPAELADESEPSAADVAVIAERFSARAQAVSEASDWCQVPPLLAEGDDDLNAMDLFQPLAVEANLEGRSEVLAAAVALAPPEISADMAATADGANRIRDLFAAAEWNALDVELVELDGIDTAMTLPAYNVARYNFDVCGFGSDPGSVPVIEGQGIESLFGGGATTEQIIAELIDRGFEPEGAACLVDNFELRPGEPVTNAGNLVTALNECELSIQLFAVVDQ